MAVYTDVSDEELADFLTRYDIGTQMGLLKANIALALKRPDLSADLRQFLSETLEAIFD